METSWASLENGEKQRRGGLGADKIMVYGVLTGILLATLCGVDILARLTFEKYTHNTSSCPPFPPLPGVDYLNVSTRGVIPMNETILLSYLVKFWTKDYSKEHGCKNMSRPIFLDQMALPTPNYFYLVLCRHFERERQRRVLGGRLERNYANLYDSVLIHNTQQENYTLEWNLSKAHSYAEYVRTCINSYFECRTKARKVGQPQYCASYSYYDDIYACYSKDGVTIRNDSRLGPFNVTQRALFEVYWVISSYVL